MPDPTSGTSPRGRPVAAQDLTIKLAINADTAEGRAALQAFAEQMGQIPDAADTASKELKGAFQQIRDDINAAFTFSAGQLMADGLKSGIEAVASFVGDSKDKFLDYETALTGVAKTTGIKGQELKGLSDQLRQSAIDLKGLGEGAATQMANISEIAGQLGIAADKIKTGNFQAATQEIAGFSETIAKAKIALPEFTGGVEEVATSTAKVIQLHGQTADSAEAILSTYNEMSNTTAANAKQIAAFMESFTMAPQLKVDIQTAAGLAATFVSMGQDANDAATRYQSAITALLKGTEGTVDAVNTAMTGSSSAQKELEAIVGRSKTSSEDFYTYFKQAVAVDSVAAVNALINAIGAMPDSVVQSQTSTEAFGQVGARVMNTLIGHTDTLKQNIDNASEAYKSATSIQEEFETAISTQGTAFAELKTKVEDIKIEIGENLVTALSQAAKTDISPAIDQFSNWLKTSQEAETFFKSTLPTAISGVSGALSTVAQKGAEAANKIAQIGTDVGTFIGDLQTGQITLGEVGAALGESLGLSQETAQQLGAFAQGAADAFGEFFDDVSSGQTTLGDLGTALGDMVGLSEASALKVGEFAQSVSDGIGELFSGIAEGKITLSEVGTAIGDLVGLSKERLSAMKGFAVEAIGGFKDLYTSIADGKITFADIAAAGDEFFDALTEQFGLSAAYDNFQGRLVQIKSAWADWKANSEAYTSAFFDGVVEQFGLSAAYDAMQTGLGKLKSAWGLDWSEWTAAPKAAFLGLWENTTSAGISAFQGLKSDVGAALAGMGDAIAQPFRDGAAAIENAFTGIGTKIGKEFDTAKQKAFDFYQSVTKNETLIGLFEKVTDKVMGVPPAMEEATTAQEDLNQSIYDGVDALSAFGMEAYGGSVYPDTTIAIVATQEAQRGLTDEIAIATEQVAELGATALESFSAFSEAVSGIGDSLSGLGGSLGDLGGLLGISELGGLGGILGDVSEYAAIPSILGDIGGQLGGVFGGLGDIDGLLGGEGLGGLLGASGLGGLGSAISGLGSSIMGGLGGAVSGITSMFGGLGGAISGILPALGPIGLAGGAIAALWNPLKGLFGSIFGEAKSEGNKANEAMRDFLSTNIEGGPEMAGAMKTAYADMKAAGFDYATFLQQTGTTMNQTFGGISQNWEQGSTSMDLFTQAVGRATGNMQKAPQVALQMVASFQDMGLSAEEAGAKMIEIAEASGMSEEAINQLRESLGGVSEDLAGSGEEGESTTAIFDAATEAAQSLQGQTDDLSGSLDEVTGQLSGTGDEGKSTGQVFEDSSRKAQSLEGQVDDLSGSLDEVTGQLSGAGAEGKSTGQVFETAKGAADALESTTRSLSSSVSGLTDQMGESGASAMETSNMFDVAGSSAGGLQGDVRALGSQADDVSAQLAGISQTLAEIPDEKEIKISVTGDAIPSMAVGGEIGHSGLAIVNERGPEIARFPGGSMALMSAHGPVMAALPVGTEIIPHSRSMDILRQYPSIPRMADGGTIRGAAALTIGTLEIHNHFAESPTSANLDRLTEQMSRKLAQQIRRML